MNHEAVNRSLPRLLVMLVAASFLSLALAQANLEDSSPADRSVVYEPLGEVTLVFDAPIDADASRFELVPLHVDAGPTDYTTGGSAWQDLDDLAMGVYERMAAGEPAPQGGVGDAGEDAGQGAGQDDAGEDNEENAEEEDGENAGAGGAGSAPGEEMDTPPPALEPTSGGETDEIVLSVTGDLQPGDYMIFYEVVSVDNGSSSGYIIFSYQPQF